MVDPDHLIQNGFVRVAAGRIIDVGQGRGACPDDKVLPHGPGVLMPALVNAHTHIDLCALKGRTDLASGFMGWVASVIRQKEILTPDELEAEARLGVETLKRFGTGIVGDISSIGLSDHLFLDSGLAGVRFQEFLGRQPPSALRCEAVSDTQTLSVAGHGPHTTSPKLLAHLKAATRRASTPFGLHLAESPDEVEFLTCGKGPWADFLAERGIDTTDWGFTGLGPVRHADGLGLLDPHTLAVHLVFADQKDVAILAKNQVHVCLCPRSNMNLHHQLPDVPTLLRAGLRPCLGTDSPASGYSLRLFDEMAFLAARFPGIAPRDILAMATANGARALGLEKYFGSLAPGKMAKMIYAPVDASGPDQVLEALVNADFSGFIQSWM